MSVGLLYLFLKMDAIGNIFTSIAMVSMLITITMIMLSMACISINRGKLDDREYYSNKKAYKIKIKYWKLMFKKFTGWPLYLSIFFIIAAAAIPSTRQVAVLYVLPKGVDFVNESGITNKLKGLADEWINELNPEVVNGHK